MCIHTQTHTHRHARAQRDTDEQTNNHIHTQRHTHAYIHTPTHARVHTRAQTHNTHTDTQTRTQTHTQTHTHIATYSRTSKPTHWAGRPPRLALHCGQGTHIYGVATSSRLLKIIGLFCKRALQKRRYSAKETCNLKEPINRRHLIPPHVSRVCVREYTHYRSLLQKSPTKETIFCLDICLDILCHHICNWLHLFVCLRLVGSLKLLVSFAKEPYKRDDILQKRLVI